MLLTSSGGALCYCSVKKLFFLIWRDFSAPGRDSLFAKLEGTGNEGALCLLSHIDVVPAEEAAWTHPSNSGAIREDAIWGRGALDMKGTGALQLQVFRMLHRMKVPLDRDVVLIAVADEEAQNLGIQHVIEKHWEEINCSHAFNEGGIGIKNLLFEGQNVFTISNGEKGVLWLRMTASGNPGHGSTPRPMQATDILHEAIARLKTYEEAFEPPKTFFRLMSLVGKHRGGFQGWLLQHPVLIRGLLKKRILSKPLSRAGTTNTINLTGLEGAIVPNVIPSSASALLDIRVLPGRSTAEMLERIKTHINDPRIDFEILSAKEAAVSPVDDPAFRALASHSALARPDAAVGPVISVGFTDSVFLRQKGVHAYGLAPFMVTDEELMGMHGHNERVSLENVGVGLRILWGAVLELAADPDSRPSKP